MDSVRFEFYFFYFLFKIISILTQKNLDFCANNPKLDINLYEIKNLIINNPIKSSKVEVVEEYWKCPFSYLYHTNTVINNQNLECSGTSFSSKAKIFDADLADLCANYNWTYSNNRINNIPVDTFQSIDTSKCVPFTLGLERPTNSGGILILLN